MGCTFTDLPILLILPIYPKLFLTCRNMGSAFTDFTDLTDCTDLTEIFYQNMYGGWFHRFC